MLPSGLHFNSVSSQQLGRRAVFPDIHKQEVAGDTSEIFTWDGLAGFTQHLQQQQNTAQATTARNTFPLKNTPGFNTVCPALSRTPHLCWVVDVLEGRVTGHHGAQVGEGAQTIEPVLGVVRLGALKRQDG